MLNCKETSHLISQSLDRELGFKERLALKMHLLMCKYCKRFSQQLSSLNVMIKQRTTHVENDSNIVMSTNLKKKIADHITES